MATTKQNREVRRQLAQLAGDPHDMEVVYPEGRGPGNPYTRNQGSGDPTDQFSELVSCRIDGQLMRLVEEQVQGLFPYYRTKSDYIRDAIFKWAKYLHTEYFAPESTGQEPVVKQLDVLSQQAWTAQQHREFAELISSIDANLTDLLRQGDEAREKLAEETADYAETIDGINDSYWRSRTIRGFVEMPCFEHLLAVLKADSRYATSGLVQLLSTWHSQRFVLRDGGSSG